MSGAVAASLITPCRKRFAEGTGRIASPAETFARVWPLAARMGITRVGDITGLDRIGIPVAFAVRPMSRSVSVTQGKGLDRDQARVSALMEAVEGLHGEGLAPRCRRFSYDALSRRAMVIEPMGLAGNGNVFDPRTEIDWIEGHDLLRDAACWVPAEVVHLDHTIAPRSEAGCFLSGSNGLGAGNCLAEALSAALFEVIERDAVAVWNARTLNARVASAVDPDSVDDSACRALIGCFATAGVRLRIWHLGSDTEVPAFMCDIGSEELGLVPMLRRFRGAGCHPDRRIALARALTEAAQTRLTYIAGSRDDLREADYAPQPDAVLAEALLDVLMARAARVPFETIPDYRSDDVVADLAWGLARLRRIGVAHVVAVDLTRPEFAIPVVRIVAPGLEGDTRHPEYVAGPRARRAAAAEA